MDILVDYKQKPKVQNKLWLYTKVAAIALILFSGASTSIMSFHSDAQIPKIFQNYYYIFFGEYNDMPLILAIPYTIGLGVGIILFFNHFSKIYVTKDPTPIEIEMTTYEKETNFNSSRSVSISYYNNFYYYNFKEKYAKQRTYGTYRLF